MLDEVEEVAFVIWTAHTGNASREYWNAANKEAYLRRTAASWMAQNGATMSQIAAVLRDRIETVEKHYAIFSPDFMGDAMNKIG